MGSTNTRVNTAIKDKERENIKITNPVTRRSLVSPSSTKGLPPVMGQLCNKMCLSEINRTATLDLC